VHYWPLRHVPPPVAGQVAQQLEASGVVDWFQTWDQLVGFWPQSLWRSDITEMADVTADCHSFHDAMMLAAIAGAATENLNLTTTTDAIRNGPAELLQSMLTLAASTGGRASIQLGAGEIKQTRSFGYKRSEGLARMEDLFRIVRKMLRSDGLISHKGNHWQYEDAWIGSVRPAIPEFWALGGGPRLMDLATSYADGLVSITPFAFPYAEDWAAQVASMRQDLERKDRDPDAFTFGLWPAILVYDDESELDAMLDHPFARWLSAIFGRLNHGQWEKEGLDLIFPADYQYAIKYRPHSQSPREIDAILAQCPRPRVAKSFITGTPKEVAEKLRPFIAGGANFIAPLDMSAAVLPLDQHPRVMERVIEICALLKEG
jgi:phthiodiolone/phenolphthiodiolone dimycocerosates ketoreductase